VCVCDAIYAIIPINMSTTTPSPVFPFSSSFFCAEKKSNSKSNNKFKLISRRRRHQSAAATIGFWPAEFSAVTLLLMCPPPTLREKAIIRSRYQSHRGHAFTRFVDFRHRRTVSVPSGHTILYHTILRTVVASSR